MSQKSTSSWKPVIGQVITFIGLNLKKKNKSRTFLSNKKLRRTTFSHDIMKDEGYPPNRLYLIKG